MTRWDGLGPLGGSGEQGVPEGEDLEVGAEALFAGLPELAGAFAGDAEFVADEIERRVLEVIPADRVGLLGGQAVEGVGQAIHQIAAGGAGGRAGRMGIGEIFVEDGRAGFFGGEIGEGGLNLRQGVVEGFRDVVGRGRAAEFVGELVFDARDGAGALTPTAGERVEPTQFVEHGAADADEAEGAGVLPGTDEAAGGVHEGLAAGGREVIAVDVGGQTRSDTGQRPIDQIQQGGRVGRVVTGRRWRWAESAGCDHVRNARRIGFTRATSSGGGLVRRWVSRAKINPLPVGKWVV